MVREDHVPAFACEPVEDGFEVRRESGRVVMKCRDEGSAVHYAVLLNEAFDAGYRAGYRDAKGSS